VAWVNLLSIYALSNYPPHGTYSASKAGGALAGAVPARGNAARRHPRRQPLSGPIDDDWNQLLPPPKIAPASLAQTIVKAVARRRRGRLPRGRRAGVAGALAGKSEGARARARRGRILSHESEVKYWARWQARWPAAEFRVLDLTHTLSPEFPQIALPPEFGQCLPFRLEEVSRYDERGPSWYWNNFSCGEHTGTHFDAPVHWISGTRSAAQRRRHHSGAALHRVCGGDRLLEGSGGQCRLSSYGRCSQTMGESMHGPRAGTARGC
jgi:hypothetical protein